MFLVSRGWDKQRLGLFHWNLQRGKPLSPFQLSQYMCLSSDLQNESDYVLLLQGIKFSIIYYIAKVINQIQLFIQPPTVQRSNIGTPFQIILHFIHLFSQRDFLQLYHSLRAGTCQKHRGYENRNTFSISDFAHSTLPFYTQLCFCFVFRYIYVYLLIYIFSIILCHISLLIKI